MSASEGYTYDDYRYDVPPRAFGTETEFTTIPSMEDCLGYIYDDSAHTMAQYVDPRYFVSPGRDTYTSAILSTGGEIYVDGPLEYATPECRTPQELAQHTYAGQQLVGDLVMRLSKSLALPSTVYMRAGYAEVTNAQGKVLLMEQSIGHHENYTSHNLYNQVPLGARANLLDVSSSARYFSDFLALRKVIDGIGMVTKDGFSITQKPAAIRYREFGVVTVHGQKQPFFQKDDRLEVRSGEGNKSDSAAAFKVGLTSLVLRLIEHNTYPRHLLLKDPNDAVLQIAKDPLAEVVLNYGGSMKGIDILKLVVDKAMKLAQQFPEIPTYETQAGTDFYVFYDKLHNISLIDNDVAALSDGKFVDWAARFQHLLDRGATYQTITATDLNQVRDDLRWDMIGNRDPARRYFNKFGHAALNTPIPKPPRTRAAVRVALAHELYQANNLDEVHWDVIAPHRGNLYRLDNVFATEHVRAKRTQQHDDDDEHDFSYYYD